ncbi:hypothetical protein [Kitasatospora sp. NPDC089509]
MEFIVSGLLAVGRGLLTVCDVVSFVDGCRILVQKVRGTKVDEEK